MNDELTSEIWQRLWRGRALDDLPIPLHQGRRDLRRLKLPEKKPAAKKFSFGLWTLAQRSGMAAVQRTTWENLDFSGSHLADLQLTKMQVVNCVFDRCKLQNSRIWASAFVDCSFVSANLRNAALGAVEDEIRNSYLRVDFSRADMTGTVYTATAFEQCSFRFTKISGVDFQTSTFKDCVFEGELSDVMFHRRGFEGERFPPNEMINVDFSRAQLRDVSFRGLTLERVTLPEDEHHLVIEDYGALLRDLVPTLRQQGDDVARRLLAFLEMETQWLPEATTRTVINLEDLEDTAGREGVDRLLQLLRKT
jgi:hypothetical protein